MWFPGTWKVSLAGEACGLDNSLGRQGSDLSEQIENRKGGTGGSGQDSVENHRWRTGDQQGSWDIGGTDPRPDSLVHQAGRPLAIDVDQLEIAYRVGIVGEDHVGIGKPGGPRGLVIG